MVKIKMLKSSRGSEDGIKVKDFKAGEIYLVVESLADVFVGQLHIAEYFVEKKSCSTPENKMISSSPSNKNGRAK